MLLHNMHASPKSGQWPLSRTFLKDNGEGNPASETASSNAHGFSFCLDGEISGISIKVYIDSCIVAHDFVKGQGLGKNNDKNDGKQNGEEICK